VFECVTDECFCLEGLGHACFVCLYAGDGWLDGLGVGPMMIYIVLHGCMFVLS
jgi:hypothetical protein